jgi:hypothetical protein
MSRHIEQISEPPDATLDRVELRIAGRNMARELWTLIDGDGVQHAYAESLLETLQLLFGLQPSTKEGNAVENNCVPIARLGATAMPFGRFNGQPLDEVPLDYLDWLCRSTENFLEDLRAYLKHPDLKSRRGRDMPEGWL